MEALIIVTVVLGYVAAAMYQARSWWRWWRRKQAEAGKVGKSHYSSFWMTDFSWGAISALVAAACIVAALVCWWGVGAAELAWLFMTRNAPLSDREIREAEEREERELRAKERAAGIERPDGR